KPSSDGFGRPPAREPKFSQPDQRMVCPRHLHNRPAVRQSASSLRASDLRQKQFGSLACTNDMQCTELLPLARWLDLTYLAVALVARIPRSVRASFNLNRMSRAYRMLRCCHCGMRYPQRVHSDASPDI